MRGFFFFNLVLDSGGEVENNSCLVCLSVTLSSIFSLLVLYASFHLLCNSFHPSFLSSFIHLVFFILVALMCLDLHPPVCSAPICANGRVGCHILSLSDLFDRVIQYSARVHSLSSNLHSDFVSHLSLQARKLLHCYVRKLCIICI